MTFFHGWHQIHCYGFPDQLTHGCVLLPGCLFQIGELFRVKKHLDTFPESHLYLRIRISRIRSHVTSFDPNVKSTGYINSMASPKL